MVQILKENGFLELYESDKWEIQKGGKYFVVRNQSSLIAFVVPENEYTSFMIAAAHSDFPSFKIKPMPEIKSEGYIRLNTEGYGSMIDSSWLDRPLSVSGRVIVEEEIGISVRLVDVDRDLLVIPNLCIHMNRNANKGYEFNHQRDLIPLAGSAETENGFLSMIADEAGVDKDKIIGYDLFLYNRTKGTITGINGEYFSAQGIDDLQCSYSALQGFIRAENTTNAIKVFASFDNEEVGSGTKQGAKSDFLKNTLERVNKITGGDCEKYMRAAAAGFMLSADNGHAVHPGFSEKSDPTNKIYMNNGVVIKYNANQHYTTDGISEAVIKHICKNNNIPYQTFTNRSDMPGGSTLGNLSNQQLSINTVDIGLAQLAMHSAYETAGVKDTLYMINAIKAFFETEIKILPEGKYDIIQKTACQ